MTVGKKMLSLFFHYIPFYFAGNTFYDMLQTIYQLPFPGTYDCKTGKTTSTVDYNLPMW